MEAHGPANKCGEQLEKSGIRRRRRFSRGDGTTDSSQCGVTIEADAGSIRLPQQLARRERIRIWSELACAACFCRSPDGCAQENKILDEELARIPQQGESV